MGLLLGALQASAFINANLTGTNIEFEGWENLNNANFPNSTTIPGDPPTVIPQPYGGGFPGAVPWTATISPNTAGSDGNAEFGKVSGNGYTAGSSVYTPFTGAVFSVDSTSVVTGLETIVFQIDLGPGDTFYNSVPTLSYNSGTQSLAADFTGNTPGENPFTNPVNPTQTGTTTNFIYQWDLSLLAPITDYSIEWETGSHAQVYGMQIDTSDSFTGSVVPEPSAYSLLAGLLATFALNLRRRRQ